MNIDIAFGPASSFGCDAVLESTRFFVAICSEDAGFGSEENQKGLGLAVTDRLRGA
jgi:hypothetical protein